VKFISRKPHFDDVDGEYIIPLRLSEEITHNLLGGWWPLGFGWGTLRPRADGSFDLFIRQREMAEDMNLVRLDSVRNALGAALDLAIAVENDPDACEAAKDAAEDVRKLVQITAQ